MLPHAMLITVILAGTMLCVMSIVDTLSYGIETAGVITRKLAISITLFNILTMFSRLSNLLSAPLLGNLPDKVYQGDYTASQVLFALRLALLFVVVGVLLGALLMPSMIKLFVKGIPVLERKGSLPQTIWHGLRNITRLPSLAAMPNLRQIREHHDFRVLPYRFLIYNIFVTCFYSIGVMSTVLAASIDHSVAGTAILLSGIVNGIATMTMFMIVDPPCAVVVDQCISGKRPASHAKTMNLGLVGTRLLGILLAIVLLPFMAQYVLMAAHWVSGALSGGKSHELGQATSTAGGLEYVFKLSQKPSHELDLQLRVNNPTADSKTISYSSGARYDFVLSQGTNVLWQARAGQRATQAIEAVDIGPHETARFDAKLRPEDLAGLDPTLPVDVSGQHLMMHPVALGFAVNLGSPAPAGGTR